MDPLAPNWLKSVSDTQPEYPRTISEFHLAPKNQTRSCWTPIRKPSFELCKTSVRR